eukprot:CAMPEP_0172357126 /NCGR_PEP_ID=MMETSP1060-20121228/1515_1 /TAXON_ID=37318 /ORGANISM="Pseudo-nitzschia pungens, Strain cf. cingulata" /LENGTH=85 /DNA_ID=CAMNT_0013077643 /DNA_START=493 /DNA_END=750 /DNA_ORIENTATION=-
METFITICPKVPASKKELMDDISGPTSGTAFAANQGVVVSLNPKPARGPPTKKPIIPANTLLRSDGRRQWQGGRMTWKWAVLDGP